MAHWSTTSILLPHVSIYEILCPVKTLSFPEILRVDIVCQQFYIHDENSILYDNTVRYQFKTVNMIMIINSRRHTENGDFDIINFFSLRRVQIVMLWCRGKSQDNVPLSGIIVNKWNVFRIFLISVILNCYLNRQHLHYVGGTCKRSFTSVVMSIVYSESEPKMLSNPRNLKR